MIIDKIQVKIQFQTVIIIYTTIIIDILEYALLGVRLMGLRRDPFRGLLSSLQISNEGCMSEPERGEQSSAFITGLFCNLVTQIF